MVPGTGVSRIPGVVLDASGEAVADEEHAKKPLCAAGAETHRAKLQRRRREERAEYAAAGGHDPVLPHRARTTRTAAAGRPPAARVLDTAGRRL